MVAMLLKCAFNKSFSVHGELINPYLQSELSSALSPFTVKICLSLSVLCKVIVYTLSCCPN